MNYAWQLPYREALVELHAERLAQKIKTAESAIQQRILQIRRDDRSNEEELQALYDALNGLRVLAKAECKTLELTPPPSSSELAS